MIKGSRSLPVGKRGFLHTPGMRENLHLPFGGNRKTCLL
ncbi:hypothetical protein ASZ90_015070 [hydrocarbon metagenome]|uniref:Uncharacterized protein n=1 Tax=hydrocarbon metagenome TaxID=938273 RepID=A0A0W8F314_9ZZZZ